MTTYTYSQPQQAPAQQSGGTDVAAWALVALVVALICAAAGWAIARNDNPSRSEVGRTSELAAREAATRGETIGYRNGAASGRADNSLRTKLYAAQARASAQREGYTAGFGEGRTRAQSRASGFDSYGMSGLGSTGAYPSADYGDVLASGAFGDVPGYADSAYSGAGYGTTGVTPYGGASSTYGTSSGDDYGLNY
ncbi:MAG: hypothetical protein H7287_06515 [Thermoleophilia bacterium]|nr:hypothetical protein [Thermoleophilia bacterium]